MVTGLVTALVTGLVTEIRTNLLCNLAFNLESWVLVKTVLSLRRDLLWNSASIDSTSEPGNQAFILMMLALAVFNGIRKQSILYLLRQLNETGIKCKLNSPEHLEM